jgi:hypothetical protein
VGDQALTDDVALLRMVWAPRCFENGRPGMACFDREDITPGIGRDGHERFVSADCEFEISKDAVDARRAHQTRGDLAKTELREEARFIRLICGDIRSLPDTEPAGENPLIVERRPVAAKPEIKFPANPAHCAIMNTSAKSRTPNKAANRAYVDYLRTQLRKKIIATLKYDEVFYPKSPA